jgi:hypothetical protein
MQACTSFDEHREFLRGSADFPQVEISHPLVLLSMLYTRYGNRLPTDLRYLFGCIFECLHYAEESERELGCACADGDG